MASLSWPALRPWLGTAARLLVGTVWIVAGALKVGGPATPAQEGGNSVAALLLEGFNGFEHALPRARAHLGAPIEDPVHRRAADPAGFGDGVDGQRKLHPGHKYWIGPFLASRS